MFRVKVKNYEGKLIMILHQTTELYKVIMETNKDETITIEGVRTNEIIIN